MATAVSMINMKGGVGKTTLAFNLAWYAAWQRDMRVLAVDLDPQANLSQYFMGAEGYLDYIERGQPTVMEIFEQFSAPAARRSAPEPLNSAEVIESLHEWADGSLLHLIPSRLELAWTLKNPTEKAHLLPRFLAQVANQYDLIIIDCAPTESILTTAAYMSSRYVVVPVKPEFLATIGLPLLARSLEEYRLSRANQEIEIAGIVFNDADPQRVKREHNRARRDVRAVARTHQWPVFDNEARHSDSYAAGARAGTAIFHTKYARDYVQAEFSLVGNEFLERVEL
ncbi:MAG: ParA family protein [Gemmataceae bacterium]